MLHSFILPAKREVVCVVLCWSLQFKAVAVFEQRRPIRSIEIVWVVISDGAIKPVDKCRSFTPTALEAKEEAQHQQTHFSLFFRGRSDISLHSEIYIYSEDQNADPFRVLDMLDMIA